MIKTTNIALGVRVKLNENFESKCLGDDALKDEQVLFISEHMPYNDKRGTYVFVKGGSLTTSGYAYLDQLDLEFPMLCRPLYVLYDKQSEAKYLVKLMEELEKRINKTSPGYLWKYHLKRLEG